jgi:hypothetical protein
VHSFYLPLLNLHVKPVSVVLENQKSPRGKAIALLTNELFIFLWSSFSGDPFLRFPHRGSLRQNKLSKLFFDMQLHVVICVLESGLQCV